MNRCLVWVFSSATCLAAVYTITVQYITAAHSLAREHSLRVHCFPCYSIPLLHTTEASINEDVLLQFVPISVDLPKHKTSLPQACVHQQHLAHYFILSIKVRPQEDNYHARMGTTFYSTPRQFPDSTLLWPFPDCKATMALQGGNWQCSSYNCASFL